MSPAAERLRYILSEDDDMPTPTLFTEMDTLQREGDELEWKESARWRSTLANTYKLKFRLDKLFSLSKIYISSSDWPSSYVYIMK